MAASHGPELSGSSLVLLLLGQTQSGKSSTANCILGRSAVERQTTRCSKQDGSVCGYRVTVVDTPGWLSQSPTPHRLSKELHRGLTLCRPGPHAILLVLPATSTFGEKELKAMGDQLRLLQTPIWQRAVVVFTHTDMLGGMSINEHIRRQGRTLHWLLERCANRYLGMTRSSSASEVTELFEKIFQMMETNRHLRELQTDIQLRRNMKEEMRWRREETRWRREETDMIKMNDLRQQVSSGFSAQPARFTPPLSFILLGRRRSGKSLAGNMILDKAEFHIDRKTVRCSVSQGKVARWLVTVVDTPGWSLFGLANPQEVKKEISRSTSLCPAGSRMWFLLAIPVGSFKEKDRKAVEEYLGVLGREVWRSTVVMFTYGEELRGGAVEKHVEEQGEPLQRLLDRCGNRYHVFDTNSADDTQVHELLLKVERL